MVEWKVAGLCDELGEETELVEGDYLPAKMKRTTVSWKEQGYLFSHGPYQQHKFGAVAVDLEQRQDYYAMKQDVTVYHTRLIAVGGDGQAVN